MLARGKRIFGSNYIFCALACEVGANHDSGIKSFRYYCIRFNYSKGIQFKNYLEREQGKLFQYFGNFLSWDAKENRLFSKKHAHKVILISVGLIYTYIVF